VGLTAFVAEERIPGLRKYIRVYEGYVAEGRQGQSFLFWSAMVAHFDLVWSGTPFLAARSGSDPERRDRLVG